ncbi:MAG: hypothetical protein WCT07_04360, partial [Candidatus Paceibacterota bacterium]
LDWVKRFNLKSENMVCIFGFDNYSSYSPRHIKNFISERRTNLKETDTLLSMINSNNYRSIPLRYLEKNKNLFLPSFVDKTVEVVPRISLQVVPGVSVEVVPLDSGQ